MYIIRLQIHQGVLVTRQPREQINVRRPLKYMVTEYIFVFVFVSQGSINNHSSRESPGQRETAPQVH